ncbi:MAG: glycogen/starch/alpha-glucan phosphorylase [Clostridia bacterium]|nr:glycogen/starch/alpha-glucan phosphorylase [Clostridia bacterium]MBQ4574092.1 glycogen/starch/alpha-glucan phosphorylase [Clostridia bacterium]
MKPELTAKQLSEAIELKLARFYGITPEEAGEEQIYKTVIMTVRDVLTQMRSEFRDRTKKQRAKRVYYMCMEFLIGRSLKNNLRNLGMEEIYTEALSKFGVSLDSIYSREPDAALGNGGLGRLAACFMDSLTTLGYPATGHSICYEYGFFKQKIVDGMQIELPDTWMPGGEVWLTPRTDKSCSVRFGGKIHEEWVNGQCRIMHDDYDEVQAIPYDMMVSGADSEAVNVLRLWRAKDIVSFNMNLFTQGQYMKAVEENTAAETISKVLYPSDNHEEGKLLRLTQQYFLCSAALQSIVADHLALYGTLANFADKVSIHLNDTHPALCIPELMRILLDVYSYSWEDAWNVCRHVFSYTNHTVMPEALEAWNEDLFRIKLPRVHMIVCEINRRLCADLWKLYPGDWDRISRMAVVGYNQVRMANLSVVGSYRVNGVSMLHSDILKKTVFHDFYKNTPDKFTNVTNGIAHRRWLCYSNPGLASLLDDCIGSAYRHEPERLADFLKFKDDKAVLAKLDEIKSSNKESFAAYVKVKSGRVIDPTSIFDVQIKRLHEYKRQLLNALNIISTYTALLENPNLDIRPQTYIFAAKAAPGYYLAKEIIKLIYCIGEDIEKNPRMREKLRVVFMEDYNVSLAEVLIPSAEISEQISLAGKEASGTSNMKFMINGALTIGTLDGANVEMHEAVGPENIYIFGMETAQVEELWKNGYSAPSYYRNSDRLRSAVDQLNIGFDGVSFEGLFQYLLSGHGVADPYMCMADFDSYSHVHDLMLSAYEDRERWQRMALINIASAGRFAADRSIGEYADNIWHIKPVTPKK